MGNMEIKQSWSSGYNEGFQKLLRVVQVTLRLAKPDIVCGAIRQMANEIEYFHYLQQTVQHTISALEVNRVALPSGSLDHALNGGPMNRRAIHRHVKDPSSILKS